MRDHQRDREKLPTTPADTDTPLGDADEWREWEARCRDASDRGEFVSDALGRDDYPGSVEGWLWIVAQDERLKRLRAHPNATAAAPAVARDAARSRIPADMRRRLDQLDATPAVEHAQRWLEAWNAGAAVDGLMLLGPQGRGKTSIACALAVEAGEPHYATVLDARRWLADELDHRREHHGGASPMDRAVDKPLLVIDDLGKEAATWERGRELIAELIERRHQVEQVRRDRDGRSFRTVVTSNLPRSQLCGEPPDHDTRYGARIASRLADMTEAVAVTGDDRRRRAAA